MPASAMNNVRVAHCLPLGRIADVLVRSVGLERSVQHPVHATLLREDAVFIGKNPLGNLGAAATPSTLS